MGSSPGRRARPRPFAGVGGTLLSAAISRPAPGARHQLDPRWAAIYHDVVRDLSAERDGADWTSSTSPPPTRVDAPVHPSGLELQLGDALALTDAGDRLVDFVATDPPYSTSSR
jgi:hypothetical protein